MTKRRLARVDSLGMVKKGVAMLLTDFRKHAIIKYSLKNTNSKKTQTFTYHQRRYYHEKESGKEIFLFGQR
jgi:hypothetical protein